jgi:hypothetical protein
MPHEARQVPSWLIFDVSQEMNASAKILEIGVNGAVVQLPKRKFPGLVIQGYSLSIMASNVEELHESIAKKDPAEIEASLAMLERSLNERLVFYESVLAKHQIQLPYFRRPAKG